MPAAGGARGRHATDAAAVQVQAGPARCRAHPGRRRAALGGLLAFSLAACCVVATAQPPPPPPPPPPPVTVGPPAQAGALTCHVAANGACAPMRVTRTRTQLRTHADFDCAAGTTTSVQNCSATSTMCYSIYEKSLSASAATFAAAPNASWPSGTGTRGCYDAATHAGLFTCPEPGNATPSSVSAAVAMISAANASAQPQFVIAKNNASWTFVLCCNSSACNNLQPGAAASTTATDAKLAVEDDATEAPINFFQEGPVVNPPKGKLSTMDIIMVGGIGVAGILVGLVVDLAATNRLMFKEV